MHFSRSQDKILQINDIKKFNDLIFSLMKILLVISFILMIFSLKILRDEVHKFVKLRGILKLIYFIQQLDDSIGYIDGLILMFYDLYYKYRQVFLKRKNFNY